MRTATRRAMVYGRRAAAGAAADWWEVAGQTCVAAYKPIGAASLAASYINLANPGTYNAAPGTAPGLAAGGWTFDGTQYLTTGIVATNNQTWSIAARISNVWSPDTTYRGILDATDGAGSFGLMVSSTGYNRFGYRSGDALWIAPIESSGILAVAGNKGYRNGVAEVGTIPTAVGAITNQILVGWTLTAGQFFLGTIAAVAIYKPTEPSTTPMSAADVAALSARMALLA